jgi:hypothetical protein
MSKGIDGAKSICSTGTFPNPQMEMEVVAGPEIMTLSLLKTSALI